ncbi:Up in starvation [Knufia obscura]|uniref:Up in starvation n=2 Tax=Knufia TaxID=430999 RepID=A0AAN8EDC0_9EURO|nr:Up in starvation [Knufia obscura]KAK5952949.1 Up in starvation [Knufia fluminis]
MAALSTLMIDHEAMSNEKQSEGQTPTTPKPSVRVRSPRPSDVATFTDPANHSEDTERNPAPGAVQEPLIGQDNTQSSQRSDHKRSNSDAMDINDSADEQDGSDDDEDQDEEGSASRKKKGQRFFCTGYPPCNLSFTRSEHLARHIRKHTGERPFQCHCNRRFSRLDNLRQHAQTVHVNEEIPTDSLAATGTRYQRQIRTDRVRPAPRPRTSTMSSASGHSRGHSRNLSTSSIGSNSSVYSNATDARRRPPPLLMAGDNRPTTPPTYSHYAAQSPADLSTPTSSTFPATPGSPNFASALGSPTSISSRPPGEMRTPGRRLSVPASYNPYYPYANPSAPSYGPGPAVPSTGSSSIVTSPTSSNFPQNSTQLSATDDWRRRTWHPSTYSNLNLNYNRPATSGLTYSQTPDAPQPAYAQNAMSAAGQAPRLPGIESFDHVQHRPTTPPRRNPTPPHPNMFPPQPLLAAPDIKESRRGHVSHVSWDGSRRSQYPEIDDNGRPTTSWGQQTMAHIDQLREAQARQQAHAQLVMGPPPHGMGILQQPQHMAKEALQLESASKRVKRSGNYNGPGPAYRTSPDSSSSDGIPTPGTSAAELHPAIMGSQGYIEPQLLAGDTQHTVSRDKQTGNTHS